MEGLIIPSLLDKDDCNGPGLGKFPRTFNGYSVDYASFKIRMFLSMENPSERLKFVKDFDTLLIQLGDHNADAMSALFNELILERPLILQEFAQSLNKILPILEKINYSVILMMIPLLEKLMNSEIDVIEGVYHSIATICRVLKDEERNKWLVTAVLGVVHDENYRKKAIGVKMVSEIIEYIDTDVYKSFIVPEMLALTEGDEPSKILALEIIPKLAKALEGTETSERLIECFLKLCEETNTELRLACVGKFKDLTFCSDEIQIQKLQPAFKEFLKDKSDKIRHHALLQLGPLIYSTSSPFPQPLIELYLKLSRNASNDKELQNHCAFYFPAVLDKLGKDSWDLMSESFIFLSLNGDISSKKSIASSLHHIAKLLEDKATTEIFPVFLNFLNDKTLRFIVLKTSGEILECLDIETRVLVLNVLKNLAKEKSFRVRAAVASSLGGIGVMLKPTVCYKELWPICKALCLDSIGHVRNPAMLSIGTCAVHIMLETPEFSNELIKDLKKFANSANFTHRLVFATASQHLISLHEFEAAFESEFTSLCQDKVATVRMVCARVVKLALKSTQRKFWTDIFSRLKLDEDRDVRDEAMGREELGIIKAGESEKLILNPAVRNKQVDKEFEEIWEVSGNESDFCYLSHCCRPSVLGYSLNN